MDRNNAVLERTREGLSEIQRFLLSIAEDLIIRKKKVNLYPLDLLAIAKEKTDYVENELLQNISELYKAKWIVPGENLVKDYVLDTLVHRKIYDYVLKNPGCDIAEIMKNINISFRYALKNLEILFKFGFIRLRKYSNHLLYFPNFMPEEEDLIFCLTRNPITRQILKYLFKRRIPVTVREIVRAIKKPEITIQRKLTRLVQAQIVSLDDIGPLTKYKITNLDENRFKKILERYKNWKKNSN